MHDREAVLKQVQAALEHEAHIDPQSAIAMSFNDGTLTLEGEVPSVGCKKLALVSAGAIGDVKGIVDRLRVTPAERAGDGATRDAVCKFLQRDIDFRNCGLNVRVKGQVETLRAPIGTRDYVVTLEGVVGSEEERKRAETDAWCLFAVDKVINHIEVRR